MPKTLALIHTSMVFVTIEAPMMQALFTELIPDVRRINILDDSLLSDVMAAGGLTDAVQQRMNAYVQSAERTGADAILSLCSSLGPAIDEARKLVSIPVIKIDDAMTERAVQEGARVGVVATVGTTLTPTLGLLKEKSQKLGKPVEIKPRLVDGAFQKLVGGDKDTHDELVSQAALELMDEGIDLLVLAQASMTRLAPRIHSEIRRTVLSSPRLAIEYTKRVLEG